MKIQCGIHDVNNNQIVIKIVISYIYVQNVSITNMIKKESEQIITKSTYHDLRPPHLQYNNKSFNLSSTNTEVGPLLDLELKFCIKIPRPAPSVIKNTMVRFRRDTRISYTFSDTLKDKLIEKKIYVKSDWQTDQGSIALESSLNLFESCLTPTHQFTNTQNPATNLTIN